MSKSKAYDLAPGNILQNMYLKHRLKKWTNKGLSFVEVGAGNGKISNILLNAGLTGVGFDLSKQACAINARNNEMFIRNNKYVINNSDFLEYDGSGVDIVISSHVMEHLSDEAVDLYFRKATSVLSENGLIVSLVPSCMRYWGIEDETVGHFRRYEYQDFHALSSRYRLKITDLAGLTYPVSNMLLGMSNFLLKKNESWKTTIPMQEQTLLSSSGVKQVKFKTFFPSYFRYFINEATMYPFFLVQLLTVRNQNCMVIYCEQSKL